MACADPGFPIWNWAPDSKFTADRNLYWSESGAPEFLGKSFAEWQESRRDANSLVADPGFVDAANRDFTLKPGSQAFDLGFEPIDISTVGLYGPKAWVQLPASIVHRTVEAAPPPEPEGRIADDFEDYDVGEVPEGAVAADGPTSATVTDEQPAEGVRCLRFVDGPVTDVWKPHRFVRRTPGTGTVRLQCSVRNDPDQPVMFDLEFRDWPQMAGATYSTGPHLRFLPDGTAQAADGAEWRAVARYQPGQWLEVEVEFQEGEGGPGTYAPHRGGRDHNLRRGAGVPRRGLHRLQLGRLRGDGHQARRLPCGRVPDRAAECAAQGA